MEAESRESKKGNLFFFKETLGGEREKCARAPAEWGHESWCSGASSPGHTGLCRPLQSLSCRCDGLLPCHLPLRTQQAVGRLLWDLSPFW